MKFYEFCQNNSGGSFHVDDKVCHRLFIEANSDIEAEQIAEHLGCYFNGVDQGLDCECCGDRWYNGDEVDLNELNSNGYEVSIYSHYSNPEELWNEKYGTYSIMKSPTWKSKYGSKIYSGKIIFQNIEEYAQFLADEHGWTKPDARIFYKNGNVKEIFKKANN
jgi:hypothetical protein